MTAKEFLRQVRNIDRRVEASSERAAKLRARLEAGRLSVVTGMPRGGGMDWTQTADRLIELERQVNARTRELVALKRAAMEAIARINGRNAEQMRELLELYYIDGYGWKQVAQRMHLDESWVFRLHGRALQRIEVPEEWRG